MLESGLVLIVIVAARIDRSHNDICRLFAICMPNDLPRSIPNYPPVRQEKKKWGKSTKELRNTPYDRQE